MILVSREFVVETAIDMFVEFTNKKGSAVGHAIAYGGRLEQQAKNGTLSKDVSDRAINYVANTLCIKPLKIWEEANRRAEEKNV